MSTPGFAPPPQWQLRGAELLADTPTSRVWKVLLASGDTAVLKALTPLGRRDERGGRHLLRWRQGHGLVRLLRAAGSQLLLEHAGDLALSTVLARDGDDAATRIATEVLAQLATPAAKPPPRRLRPLREHYAALLQRARSDGHNAPYLAAAALAQRLLDTAASDRPLHGDLHHDNIFCGQRGWLAIDPKGLIGDPAFEAANLFFNPLDRDDLCRDPARIAGMAVAFGAALEQSPRRVLDHAAAYGALSAAWFAEDGDDEDETRQLAVSAVIAATARQF